MIATLEEARGIPVAVPHPLRVSSSAAPSEPSADSRDRRAGPASTDRSGSLSGPSQAAALASLSTPKLRSIVTAARQNHGPHRMRWSNRERRAWDELNKRGAAA